MYKAENASTPPEGSPPPCHTLHTVLHVTIKVTQDFGVKSRDFGIKIQDWTENQDNKKMLQKSRRKDDGNIEDQTVASR